MTRAAQIMSESDLIRASFFLSKAFSETRIAVHAGFSDSKGIDVV